jgi:nitroreductase
MSEFNLPEKAYLDMDEVEFRARFRERTHHTLEIQVYHAAYRKKRLSNRQADTVKKLSRIWVKRGISVELYDYKAAQKLIEFAEALAAGKGIDLSPYAPHPVSKPQEKSFFAIIHERRSVREFKKDRVDDELIDKILDAGLWAAHSCNLQSLRYLVVREETSSGLFRGSDIPGGPVHVVICQDYRVYQANPYNPVRNRLLDAGAAAQNIALAAHAAGLEGVWLTFTDKIKERLIKKFDLPEHVEPVTYVDIGYGDQTPYPLPRPQVKDVVLGRG